jgi:tetratricopeptide (TPR) repeat protein
MDTHESTIIAGFRISSSPEVINKQFGVTPDIEEKLSEMGVKVQKKKNSAVKDLNNLIKKYPHIPQFKNYLATLYQMQGNQNMANKLNRRIVSLHPDYLYGKINEANIAIANEMYEKVPEILGPALDLKLLYPARKEFLYSEVLDFLKTVFNYYFCIKDVGKAETTLEQIMEINEEFEAGINADEFTFKMMTLKLWENSESNENTYEQNRTPEVIAKQVEQSTEAPVFNHELINELYCNDMRIDPQVIQQILALPRETLLDDLHKVVYDSMTRHEFFREEMDWTPQTHEFLMHALLLLVELNDESSIDVILDILRQDAEYLEIWFSDFLTEVFWELIYHIANNKLDVLRMFIMEPNRYTYSCSMITEVAQQIILHQPGRRQEVTEWYKGIFQEWIVRQGDETLINTELIAYFVSDVVNLNLINLEPLVSELFNHGLVSVGVSGTKEHCLKDLYRHKDYDRKREVFASIAERYKYYLSYWHYYNGDPISQNEKLIDSFRERGKDNLVAIDEKPKIGRNDPCPCGSGKKFKKCCGNV